MTNENNNDTEFNKLLTSLLSDYEKTTEEEIIECFQKFPAASKRYVMAWKDLFHFLNPNAQKVITILLNEIEKSKKVIPEPIPEPVSEPVSEPIPDPVSKPTPEQIKLKVHEKELIMLNADDIATNNSNLMISVVETPKQALSDLEKGLYSLEEINYPNSMGWTPLMYVARHKLIEDNIKLMKELIRQGALVNQCSKKGNYILYMVSLNTSRESSLEALDLLLSHPNILVNQKVSEVSLTALLGSVALSGSDSSVETVRRLLEHPDCDPNMKNNDGADAFLNGLRFLKIPRKSGCYSTSKDALILLVKSPKYKLTLKDKLEWITKYSADDNSKYLEIILNLYQEHNPTGIFL